MFYKTLSFFVNYCENPRIFPGVSILKMIGRGIPNILLFTIGERKVEMKGERINKRIGERIGERIDERIGERKGEIKSERIGERKV